MCSSIKKFAAGSFWLSKLVSVQYWACLSVDSSDGDTTVSLFERQGGAGHRSQLWYRSCHCYSLCRSELQVTTTRHHCCINKAVFRLSLVGRNLSALEATKARCVEQGCSLDNVLIIKCDLRSELECQQAVRKTTHFYGGLTDLLLINTAKLKFSKQYSKHKINIWSQVLIFW